MDYMDDSNMRYSDYINDWELVEAKEPVRDETASTTPRKDCVIDWQGEHWAVFSTDSVGPEITNRSGELEDYRFLVTVSDAGKRQSIRPI